MICEEFEEILITQSSHKDNRSEQVNCEEKEHQNTPAFEITPPEKHMTGAFGSFFGVYVEECKTKIRNLSPLTWRILTKTSET